MVFPHRGKWPRLVMERFWSKVDKSGDCWLWTGCTQPPGYGRFRIEPRTVYAHRFAYEELVGPIPDGLVLDHLCRTPACVNPEHLEPVPQRVNIERGARNGMQGRTHCVNGHEFSGHNLIATSKGRVCRACKNERGRAYKQRRRAA